MKLTVATTMQSTSVNPNHIHKILRKIYANPTTYLQRKLNLTKIFECDWS